MKDQFIPYEHAKIMKELGFDSDNRRIYLRGKLIPSWQQVVGELKSDIVIAPLWQEAEEWLWEKHGIYLDLIQIPQEESEWIFQASICNSETCYDSAQSTSPITAHHEGILKAIEYIHKQTK